MRRLNLPWMAIYAVKDEYGFHERQIYLSLKTLYAVESEYIWLPIRRGVEHSFRGLISMQGTMGVENFVSAGVNMEFHRICEPMWH